MPSKESVIGFNLIGYIIIRNIIYFKWLAKYLISIN